MSTTTQGFKAEEIGRWSDPVEFAVTRERIQAYAAATNDPIAPHAAGDYASPVFAVVPAFGAAGAAATKVIPGELLMMILHGEQDFHFHKPIEPRMTVITRADGAVEAAFTRHSVRVARFRHFYEPLRVITRLRLRW